MNEENQILNKHDLLLDGNSFKTYTKSLFLCCLLCFSMYLALSYSLVGKYIVGADRWIAVAQKHKKNAARSFLGKRILIVSGSNALFGISAETISQKTGIPTINLAIHAGLGIKYILNDAKTVIREGDTILLPLEYTAYTWNGKINNIYLRHVLSNDAEYFHSFNVIEQINHVIKLSNEDIVSSLIFRQSNEEKSLSDLKLRASEKKCYAGYLNQFGDELCNIGGKPSRVLPNPLNISEKYEIDKMGVIRDFLTWCKQNNVKVLALYPVMAKRDEFKQEEYQRFFHEIKNFYAQNQIPILGDPYQLMLPHDLMFNTHYHPNDKGRNVATQQILSLIKDFLD